MMIEKTTVYILSRDRPIYLKVALDSVLKNSSEFVTIVVSDNSVGNDVEEMMKIDYSSILYMRRSPPIPIIDHLRIIFQEAGGDYLVLFHDDDIMMPRYIDNMLAMFAKNTNVVAIGCNAKKIYGDTKTEQLLMCNFNQPKLITDVNVFLRPYLTLSLSRPAPFPGYMYRRRLMGNVLPDVDQGGIYSDVSFLVKLLRCGSILLTPEPLMWYRFHSSNVSGKESIVDHLSLLRYLITYQNVSLKSSDVLEYKFLYWTKWWLQRGVSSKLYNPNGLREKVVSNFLIKNAIKICLTRPIVWRLVLRILRKFFIKV
jgi:hypothetical protein